MEYVVARIKITKYVYHGKERYLAEIKKGRYTRTFNESTLKKLLKRLSKEVY